MTKHGGSGRSGKESIFLMLSMASVAVCASCSLMFPHVERVIQPEGTSLEEVGIALVADFEGWIDSVLYVFGLFGLV